MKCWLAYGLLCLGMLAMPALGKDTVYYYYTDALHSTVVQADAQGNIVEQSTYYAPYGQVLNRPMRDGPGYTGHEEDPSTGLDYMQQRYFDPQSGRFISTDPVLPTNDGGNFNRYWYANDNPYRYTDPSGTVVEVQLEQGLMQDYQQTMAYLSKSPTFAKMYSTLENSPQVYRVQFLTVNNAGGTVHSKYWQALHTVRINPKLGMKIKSSGKIESPAIVAAHEIAHAYLQNKLGEQKFLQTLNTPVTKNGATVPLSKDSAGEEQATDQERQVANELGAPVRSSYTDVVPGNKGFVNTCSATSSKECQN